MGAHLSSPRTEKSSSFGGSSQSLTCFGSSSMQGWRISMEDAHLAFTQIPIGNFKIALYGVFDGHGGSSVSNWVAENFATLFNQEIQRISEAADTGDVTLKCCDFVGKTEAILAESLQSAFLKVDEELAKPDVDVVLQGITERLRMDSGDLSTQHDANLLRVLLPEKISNRLHVQNLVNSLNHMGTVGPQEQDIELINIDSTTPNILRNDGGVSRLVSTCNVVDSNDELSHANMHESSAQTEADLLEQELDEALATISPQEDGGLAYGCGAASVVVVILEGDNPCILVANAGDSRAVLCRNGRAVALTHDHKPQLQEEGERIRRAGGCVTNGRVDGNLNLSRAIGDLSFKRQISLSPKEQRITAFPDVRITPLTARDEFIVLACDGIWDVKTNQQVVDFVRSRLGSDTRPEDLSRICEELCDACLSNNPNESEGIGCDNMTVVIVLVNCNVQDTRFATIRGSNDILLYGKSEDVYLER